MINGVDIFAYGLLTLVFGYLLYIIYYTLDLFFLNPFKRITPLTKEEEKTILYYLPFYKDLSKKKEAF